MAPRTILKYTSLCIALLLIPARQGWARLTVQQPAFGVNSVTTTVSVPDRGRAHLGSIGRARDSRSQFGPFRSGSTMGLDREHSGMSVGVYIHDFAAMDRYLLSQGSSASAASSAKLSRQNQHAWRQLQSQHGGRTLQTPAAAPIAKSEKYWRLGQKAEREGKVTVARLHYRIASKYGSRSAKTRLAELADPRTPAQVATRER